MPVEPDLRRWLAAIGAVDCMCGYEWKSLGRLHGVDMGKGWVRVDTAADCPHHVSGGVKEDRSAR